MALPPILTNSPIFRVLTGNQDRPVKDVSEKTPVKNTPGDSVTLSDEALRKLEELQSADINGTDKARNTASNIRTSLEQNPELTLGYDEKAGL